MAQTLRLWYDDTRCGALISDLLHNTIRDALKLLILVVTRNSYTDGLDEMWKNKKNGNCHSFLLKFMMFL